MKNHSSPAIRLLQKNKTHTTQRNKTFQNSFPLKNKSHNVPMWSWRWMCADQMSFCVWSFRHVCAVGVYLFKLSPVTRYSLFWSLECRIKCQSRAATSKLTSKTSTPLPEQESTLLCWQNSCGAVKSLSEKSLIFLYSIYIWLSKQQLTLTRHPNNTLWITCSAVFYAAVISWTSALAWATWSQTVQTICPWGLTHSQTLHQIVPCTYPVSCITVLKSLFWARC